MFLDLRVGPIRAPTLIHVMEGNTSYHIILGRPWLKAYKDVAPTYIVWRNKQGVTRATRMPFDRAELHFAKAAPYQEYEPEGENKILPFNPIALQREEKDDGEVVEPESLPRSRESPDLMARWYMNFNG